MLEGKLCQKRLLYSCLIRVELPVGSAQLRGTTAGSPSTRMLDCLWMFFCGAGRFHPQANFSTRPRGCLVLALQHAPCVGSSAFQRPSCACILHCSVGPGRVCSSLARRSCLTWRSCWRVNSEGGRPRPPEGPAPSPRRTAAADHPSRSRRLRPMTAAAVRQSRRSSALQKATRQPRSLHRWWRLRRPSPAPRRLYRWARACSSTLALASASSGSTCVASGRPPRPRMPRPWRRHGSPPRAPTASSRASSCRDR